MMKVYLRIGDSVLVPLYKGKGDVRDCGAYNRGVKLLEHGMKVVERVVEKYGDS